MQESSESVGDRLLETYGGLKCLEETMEVDERKGKERKGSVFI